jgi:tetratricopeptide (TPR) repeat protein
MRRSFLIAGSIVCIAAAGASQTTPEGLERAAQRAPLSSELRERIGAAVRSRELEPAEQLLADEIGRNPRAQPLYTLLSDLMFLDRKYLNSVVVLKKAQKLGPLPEANRFTLAMNYVLLRRSDLARTELEGLARDHPRNALYPYWVARFDYHDQKFAAAVAKLQATVALDPAFMKAYDKLELSLEALGQFDAAIVAYRKAIELNQEKWPWPAMNLGALLRKLGHYEEAEPFLRQSVDCDASFAQAHYQLGALLELKKQLPEAAVELKHAIDLDPANPEPLYALGRVYRDLGDTARAAEVLAQFQRLKKQPKERAQEP